VVVSFSYDRGVRTMMGVRPSQMAARFAVLGVDLLGINCGRSLEENLQVLQELRSAAGEKWLIWFKPNAGLPSVDAQGVTVYKVTPQEMGALVPDWIACGANVVGGCCGASPAHLAQIVSHTRRA
jgi:5-methyltetrahydrofolate--homocysteine methyltransferase